MKDNNIDIIHSNAFAAIIAGSILGILTRVPVISAVLDVFTGNELAGWSKWVQTNNLPKYYAQVGMVLEKLSLMMPVEIFHTISKSTMSNIKKMRRNAKIRVIYPGIDTSEYIRHKNDLKYCDFILFIGRLVFYKNLDVLIKAFHSVLHTVPNSKLVIVGNGPMKETWEKLALSMGISKNVMFRWQYNNL